MNKNDFIQGINQLELAYSQKFDKEKLELWWKKLNNMNANIFKERVDSLINTKKFMPSIADILEQKERISNFEGRDYSNFDFNSLLANRDIFV